MIPTSIDGTDITGATIDGTDVQEITVDGQTVFTAQTIIDDFERGDFSPYTVTSSKQPQFAANPLSGSFSLSNEPSSTAGVTMYSNPGDGLDNYPQPGDTFAFTIASDSSNMGSGAIFGVDASGTSINDTNRIYITNSGIFIGSFSGGLNSGGSGANVGSKYRAIIDWQPGFATMTVNGLDGAADLGSVSSSVPDPGPGFGFLLTHSSSASPDGLVRIDDVEIL